MRLLNLIAIFLVCQSCTPVYAGYTVFPRPQIAPQYVTVHTLTGTETYPNPGAEVIRPATFGKMLCTSAPFSPYSSAINRRQEVWTDSAGTATSLQVFTACPQLRDDLEANIRRGAAARLEKLTAPYSVQERETWPYQRAEALAWQADRKAATPFCDAIALSRNIPRTVFLAKVLENDALFTQAATQILGLQQQLIDRIWAETDIDRLLTIKWPE